MSRNFDKAQRAYKKYKSKYLNHVLSGGNILAISLDPETQQKIYKFTPLTQTQANRVVRYHLMLSGSQTEKFKKRSSEGFIYDYSVSFVKKKIFLGSRIRQPWKFDNLQAHFGGDLDKLNLAARKRTIKLKKELTRMINIFDHPSFLCYLGGSYMEPESVNIRDQASYDDFIQNNYILMDKMTVDLYDFLFSVADKSMSDVNISSFTSIFNIVNMFLEIIKKCDDGIKFMISKNYINTDLKLENIFVKYVPDKKHFSVYIGDPNFVSLDSFPNEYLREHIVLSNINIITPGTPGAEQDKTFISPIKKLTEDGRIKVEYNSTDDNTKTCNKLKSNMYYVFLMLLTQIIVNFSFKTDPVTEIYFSGIKLDKIIFTEKSKLLLEHFETIKLFFIAENGIYNMILANMKKDLESNNYLKEEQYDKIIKMLVKLFTKFENLNELDGEVFDEVLDDFYYKLQQEYEKIIEEINSGAPVTSILEVSTRSSPSLESLGEL